MKRQNAAQIVGLSLLGLFLLSVVGGCGGGKLTSLSKEEFQKKVEGMSPEEVVKWLGKPTSVADDNGVWAHWHYRNVCNDKITGKNCNATLDVLYNKPTTVNEQNRVRYCEFSSD